MNKPITKNPNQPHDPAVAAVATVALVAVAVAYQNAGAIKASLAGLFGGF